ncbi:FGGY family carbohydrate kinase [Dactylosporangium sp. NBC_01737]|uniref:FGGY family carbohydrate kinase n=1 Tax=Dactylosporangium sp. NBC_01737 TaxID=2975959 RepID=UPI002E1516F9|nr:FGGY family carbohydrate kinase [Dactylosporangium sp. NBC_01737]
MDMHILAIDQGTSGTKAIVAGADGAVLAIAEEPLRPSYLPGGAVEQDPLALLDSVLTAGRRAVAAAGVPRRRSPWPTRARRSSRGTGPPARR